MKKIIIWLKFINYNLRTAATILSNYDKNNNRKVYEQCKSLYPLKWLLKYSTPL